MDQTMYSPVRRGRHVTLRPVRPDDYGPLYHIAMYTDAGSRWRLHGGVPPFDQFVKILLEGAPASFAIETNEDGQIVGMVQLWNYNAMNRNGHITAFLDPAVRGRGWPLEGVLLFVEYVFPVFNLHKLYFESLETEVEQYGSMVGPILKPEAHFPEHQWAFGRLADCHVLALYEQDVSRLLQLAFPRGSTVPDAGAEPRSVTSSGQYPPEPDDDRLDVVTAELDTDTASP